MTTFQGVKRLEIWRKKMTKKTEDLSKDVSEETVKSEFPKNGSSGRGTTHGYTVEARHNYPDPVAIGRQIFDNRWREVHYQEGHPGVPTRKASPHDAGSYHTFDFAGAQALRWWFHAEAEASPEWGVCLETRLVRHEITYEYSVKAVSAHEHTGGDAGDFSSRSPKSPPFAENR